MTMLKYRKNVYSQNGEDGILEEVIKKLNIHNGTFVEFGAWDGKYLSNTYYFYEKFNFSGVYIEYDSEKFKESVSFKYCIVLFKNIFRFPNDI